MRVRAIAVAVYSLLILASLDGSSSQLNSAPNAIDQRGPGVVVETVAPGSSGARAGITPGDILLRWSTPASSSGTRRRSAAAIRSPFDLDEVEGEQAQRGALTLHGTRAGKAFDAAMPPGVWGISSHPRLAPSDPEVAAWLSMRAAMSLRPGGNRKTLDADRIAAQQAWTAAVTAARKTRNPVIVARVLEAQGDSLFEGSDFARSLEQYAEAIEVRERMTSDSLAVVQLVAKRTGAQRMSVTPITMSDVARIGYILDDEAARALRAADHSLARSAEVAERLAPNSSLMVQVLAEQALVAARQLEVDAARKYQQRALEIEKRLVPATPVASSTSRLVDRTIMGWEIRAQSFLDAGGNFIGEQAYLSDVQRDLERASQIFERIYPGCDEAARKPDGAGPRLGCRKLAQTLNNLGMVTAQRGNPASGQRFIERALLINEALRAHKVYDKPLRGQVGILDDVSAAFDVGRNLNNLGTVAWLRGDLDTADDFYTRVRDMRRKCGPACASSLSISYRHLARVEVARGNSNGAADLYRQALTIDEADLKSADPRFSNTQQVRDVVAGYTGLGDVAYALRNNDEARGFYNKARDLQQESVSKSLEFAQTLTRLAAVDADEGDLPLAEKSLRQALIVADEVVPDSAEAATAAHALATVLVRSGRLDEAATFYSAAISALESHSARLGGAEEVRGRFIAKRRAMYYDYIKLLVDRRDHAAAFELVERSNAQSLRSLLAERDLAFSQDLPDALDRQRRAINGRYEKTYALLRIGQGAEEDKKLTAQLQMLRNERQAMADTIRERSPRLAAIEYPRPLTAEGAALTLDAGTVLLSYAVGETETLLFVVQSKSNAGSASPALEVIQLPIGRRQLFDEVQAFRRGIDPSPQSSGSRSLPLPSKRPAAESVIAGDNGNRLFDILIRPAYSVVARSTRVLIAADGPLQSLPFAALVERRANQDDRYLIEWKPIHAIVSATVYEEVKKRRSLKKTRPAIELVAFGDPDYSGAVDGRRGLEALPGTRQEVDQVSALYAPRAQAYLGRLATEEQLKKTAAGSGQAAPRYLHIASHGLLDEKFPLDSALALSAPQTGSESTGNGLLQAWEIYEQVRIDADLVALSACETGLGEDIGGEGLISLSRAFLYAGAHSVLASLWAVNDLSTAPLMAKFYENLKAGLSKDEALRAAQLDFIRRKKSSSSGPTATGEWSHPYHWAGFSVVGDWK
jgi:CHAT domain-containing protein/tetratricopeptide (TPR) repeat protein